MTRLDLPQNQSDEQARPSSPESVPAALLRSTRCWSHSLVWVPAGYPDCALVPLSTKVCFVLGKPTLLVKILFTENPAPKLQSSSYRPVPTDIFSECYLPGCLPAWISITCSWQPLWQPVGIPPHPLLAFLASRCCPGLSSVVFW